MANLFEKQTITSKNKSKALALIMVLAFLAAVWDSLPKTRRNP